MNKESINLIKSFYSEAGVDKEGIVRWNNGLIPLNNVLIKWKMLDLPFDYKKTNILAKKEREVLFEEYVSVINSMLVTEEELEELRKEFLDKGTMYGCFSYMNLSKRVHC